MVWDVSFTCDICGKQKGESNHWWMAIFEQPAGSDQRGGGERQENRKDGGDPRHEDPQDGDPELSGRFTLVRWSAETCCDQNLRHLCGQGCAMQALERFMTLGSF